jgi:hypothetical protein
MGGLGDDVAGGLLQSVSGEISYVSCLNKIFKNFIKNVDFYCILAKISAVNLIFGN